MEVKVTFVLVSACIIVDTVIAQGLVGKKPQNCSASGIAVYEVELETFWSREKFSKQYPLYRPNAQWSRTVGRTHGTNYVMWREDSLASNGIMQFAETGLSADLDEESQGYKDIFDIFSLPKIETGVGKTSTYIFVDGGHPLVSLASRIIPSPDWFVGLDSLSLCGGGKWASKKRADLRIWDAGTDKGLTFTSPNWPEVPHRPIERITASRPNHPASSFHYPDVAELPVIATATFTRRMVTDLSLVQNDWTSPNDDNSDDDDSQQHGHRLGGETTKGSDRPSTLRLGELGGTSVRTAMSPISSHEPVGKKVADTTPVKRTQADGRRVSQKKRKGKLTKEERRKRRLERKKRKNSKKNKKQGKQTLKRGSLVERKQKDVDCQVSEWQSWSACSKTCGYGTRTRRRTVVTETSGRGVRCPPLVQEEICGSMRGCGWTHFSSDNWGTLGALN